MTRQQHLVIGHKGQVGAALYTILQRAKENVSGIDLTEQVILSREYDFIHICLPGNDPTFWETTARFLGYGQTGHTINIIHSSVPPFTVAHLCQYYPRTVYSPVRGTHPNLVRGLLRFPKFFATPDSELAAQVQFMFGKLGIVSVPVIDEPRSLEFAKLLNTTYYAHMISFTQEVVRLSQKYDLNKETIYQFIQSTGDRTLLPYAQKIGGHCLIPNAKILSQYTPIATNILTLDSHFGAAFGEHKFVFQSHPKAHTNDKAFPGKIAIRPRKI